MRRSLKARRKNPNLPGGEEIGMPLSPVIPCILSAPYLYFLERQVSGSFCFHVLFVADDVRAFGDETTCEAD